MVQDPRLTMNSLFLWTNLAGLLQLFPVVSSLLKAALGCSFYNRARAHTHRNRLRTRRSRCGFNRTQSNFEPTFGDLGVLTPRQESAKHSRSPRVRGPIPTADPGLLPPLLGSDVQAELLRSSRPLGRSDVRTFSRFFTRAPPRQVKRSFRRKEKKEKKKRATQRHRVGESGKFAGALRNLELCEG